MPGLSRTTGPEFRHLRAVMEALALDAGRFIMAVLGTEVAVERKADHSPVTDADRGAEKIILRGLRAAFPDFACIAEEEVSAGLAPAETGDAFFLIDPLDGTREFVGGRSDFTVNIALVRDGVPETGVVYAPARGELYSGLPGLAERIAVTPEHREAARGRIAVAAPSRPPRILASRSHGTAETAAFIRCFEGAQLLSIGSSLKFCKLACGEADFYPRFGRTMEWDTAAGDAILRAAGGETLGVDGAPLPYGKRGQADDVDFANPWFVAVGGADGRALLSAAPAP